MSRVAEIKSAIEQRSIEQMREKVDWLDEYKGTISTSAAVFAVYGDQEEEDRLPS